MSGLGILPPSVLIKQVTWTIDMIENYVSDIVTRYLKQGVPVDLSFLEDPKPIPVVMAGYSRISDLELQVNEVVYLGESDGSEELQLTVNYEFPNMHMRIISPIFFMRVFSGVVIVKQHVVNLGNYSAELRNVKVMIVGKKYEKVRERVEQILKQSKQ